MAEDHGQFEDRVQFVYALDGDVEAIDVFAIAPTLLSLGRLIQDSSRALNPIGEPLAVNVRPFRAGSFVVDVVVFAQSQEPQAWLAAGAVAAPHIVQVLKAIGLIADVKSTAVSLLKKLRGRPKDVAQVGPGEYRYTIGDENISVSGDVHQLVQNQTIVQNIQNVYATPLSDPRVKAVRSYIEGSESSTEVRIEKGDVSALRAPSDSTGPGLTASNLSTVYVNPKRVAVDGDRVNWSFRRGEKEVISATIRDDVFLGQVRRGEIRLHSSDLLKVELQEVQRVESGKITSSREILRVIEYVPGRPEPEISENP